MLTTESACDCEIELKVEPKKITAAKTNAAPATGCIVFILISGCFVSSELFARTRISFFHIKTALKSSP
jgi:hypothetical protein